MNKINYYNALENQPIENPYKQTLTIWHPKKVAMHVASVAVFLGGALPGHIQAFDLAQSAVQPRLAFDVASVKVASAGRRSRVSAHGRLTIRSESLLNLIIWAYGIDRFRVSGPDWIVHTYYDISAKADDSASEGKIKLMLQALLVERLKLTFHHETKSVPVIAMTIGRKRPRLAVSTSGDPYVLRREGGRVVLTGATMADLAAFLSGDGSRTFDMTGITDRFNVTLDFHPYLDASTELTTHSVVDAFREAATIQLGVKFGERKVPVYMLIIDHAEKVPMDN
jgi:uncharacterized protein (TIGR03435 family)